MEETLLFPTVSSFFSVHPAEKEHPTKFNVLASM
jgi:hypothetical protein